MGRKGNRIAELRNSNISLTFTSGLESFTDGWPMETYMFLFEYRLPKRKMYLYPFMFKNGLTK